MSMVVHRHLGPHTDITWATPTSGFGHVADEQPLPYVHHCGQALTPMFGGEESQPACSPYTAGLPYGTLATNWPTSQRRFNWMRKPINLYWRNIFISRSPLKGPFLFLHQLNYRSTPHGFTGVCAVLNFERRFVVHERSIEVHDTTVFKTQVRFAEFWPICVPLFLDWQIGGTSFPRLDPGAAHLIASGEQRSAAGNAILWVETLHNQGFAAGERLDRQYAYYW